MNILKEIIIYTIVFISWIPATIIAMCVTLNNMFWNYPDDAYRIIKNQIDD